MPVSTGETGTAADQTCELTSTIKCTKGYRVGSTTSAFRHLYRRGHTCLVRIKMTDGWIRARRGIEDTVVIEFPSVPDVALRRIQRRRQSDIDEVASLATLILHASRERDGRRGESSPVFLALTGVFQRS